MGGPFSLRTACTRIRFFKAVAGYKYGVGEWADGGNIKIGEEKLALNVRD
jgi:hypothetical protein